MATHRVPLPLILILAALPATLAWACGGSDEPPGEWPELPGGSGGAGGAPTTSSGDPTSSGGAGGTGGAGGMGGEGGAGDVGGAGGMGGAGGGACEDPAPDEPNETEADATYLGLITDDDDDASSFSGTLPDAGDVDWVTYSGVDTFMYTVDPTRSFSAGLFRVCKFAECVNGAPTDVTCYDGSTSATSPAGRQGCCHTSAFSINVDCVGEDDDTKIYVRVDQATTACASYTISFHY